MAPKQTVLISFCVGSFVLANVLLIFLSTYDKDITDRRYLSRHRRDTDLDINHTTAANTTTTIYTTTTTSSTHQSTLKPPTVNKEEENLSHSAYHETNTTHERFHVISVNWARVADPFVISIWIVIAGITKIVFHYASRFVSRVPESCLLICLGLLVGGIAYAVNRKHRIEELLFNPDTFFLFILPPIVMEAGYFMPKDPFLDNLGSILLYAIVGTIFNAMAIGVSLYGAFKIDWMPGMEGLTLFQCLLFGSIISAVDPVAVISVFEEIHVNTVLYICVFGESLLNDGVAVVMFHMFEGFIEIDLEGTLLPIDYVAAIASFFVVAFGGLLIGILYGYAGSFITKFTHHNRIVEPTFVFIMCYLAYLTAEIFHLSGIIAIVFAGFTMNSYVEHNISAKSHTTVKYGMKMLANICETIIFMLLGIAAVSDFWQYWNTAFVLWTLLFITIYRAIGVVVLTAILNYFRLDKINRVDQFVMAYGGLRGAIAFSLVSLTSPALVPSIKTMVCACIVCILFTSFVQGSTIRPIVEFLHVKTTSSHKVTMMEDINLRLIEHLMTGVEDIIGHRGHHYWEQKWNRFNSDYLMKWFVREPYHSHDAEILETFHRINKREAACLIQEIGKGGSFANGMQSEKTLANLLLASDIRKTGSHVSLGAMIKTNNQSDVCLDIRAIDTRNVPVTGSLHDAHHMLKENMYKPRTVETPYKRGELPSDGMMKRQEQEILIRRRIHQRKRKHKKHHKHGKHNTRTHLHLHDKHEHSGCYKPDMEEVPEITVSQEQSSIHEEDVGITFKAKEEDEPDAAVPDEPEPSCSKELPWKSIRSDPVSDFRSSANLAKMDSPGTREYIPPAEAESPQSTHSETSAIVIEMKPSTSKDTKVAGSDNGPNNNEEETERHGQMIDTKMWETIEEDVV